MTQPATPLRLGTAEQGARDAGDARLPQLHHGWGGGGGCASVYLCVHVCVIEGGGASVYLCVPVCVIEGGGASVYLCVL